MEDKYIGIILAMSGTLAIGTSFIITKMVSVLGVKWDWAKALLMLFGLDVIGGGM